MSKMMENVEEKNEAIPRQGMKATELLEEGFYIIDREREMIDVLTKNELQGLYAVLKSYPTEPWLTRKDIEILKAAMTDLENDEDPFGHFYVMVDLYHYMKDRKSEIEAKSRKCCKSVKSNGRNVPEAVVQHGAVEMGEEIKNEAALVKNEFEVLQHDAHGAHAAHHGVVTRYSAATVQCSAVAKIFRNVH